MRGECANGVGLSVIHHWYWVTLQLILYLTKEMGKGMEGAFVGIRPEGGPPTRRASLSQRILQTLGIFYPEGKMELENFLLKIFPIK